MKCAACQAELTSDYHKCQCGQAFCTKLSSYDSADGMKRTSFHCWELHHCTRKLEVAIVALELAHAARKAS